MINKNIKITIVTVCYNAASTIEETLQSVINQTYNNVDFVIIDGGSTDGTLEIIDKYQSKISKLVSEPDNGIYEAMNKACAYIKDGWVLFLGADDKLQNEMVLEEVSVHLQDSKTIYYGNSFFKKRQKLYDGFFGRFKFCLRNISHQAIFYPAIVCETYRYDVTYKLMADYALNLRLFGDKSFRFKYVPLLISIFNDDSSSANNIDSKFEQDKPMMVLKNLGLLPFLYIRLRKLLKVLLGK